MQISSTPPKVEPRSFIVLSSDRYEFVQTHRRQGWRNQKWKEVYKSMEAANNEGTFFTSLQPTKKQ